MQIDNLVDKILSELGLSTQDTLSKKSSILCIDAIYALIMGDTIKEASSLLEVSEDSLEQTLRRHFKDYCGKDSNTKWSIFLLGLVEHRKCLKCSEILPYSNFSLNCNIHNNKNNICKVCDTEKSSVYRLENMARCLERSRIHYQDNKSSYLHRNAMRRALKLNATPAWADLTKIREIYVNCPIGYHVDHIVPLQGKLVSGLHVEGNLQYLTSEDNLKKHNKFVVE